MSPAPCPPRNSRGRNTRNEAQPSPASQGEAQPERGVGAADRLGMSWNEPARRSYGNAADPHRPRPGDGQIRDSTLP